MLYKIFRCTEWRETEKAKFFDGSPDDLRDGFIHLRSAAQLCATCDNHFPREDNFILAAVDNRRLAERLRWEEGRNGVKFPHLNGSLPLSGICWSVEIRRGPDGRPIFPSDIP